MAQFKTLLGRWWIPLVLLALAPAFWYVAQIFAEHTDIVNSNFFKIWLAGHLAATGGNPYSASDWLAGHLAFHSAWVPEKGFLYPLPLVYILWPFGMLPPQAAYRLWAFVSILACVAAIFILANQQQEFKLKLFATLLAIALLLFPPTLETIGKGTIGAILLLAGVGAIEFSRREKPFASGALFSVLLLKPQLGVPILGVIGLWMLIRRDWRGLSGLAGGSLFLFVLGALRDLHWVQEFLNISQQKLGSTFGDQPTLFSIATRLCSYQQNCTIGLGLLLSGLCVAGVAYLLFRKGKTLSALEVFSLAAPFGMLVTPYLWSYDHVLLLIPFIWLAYWLILRTKTYTVAMVFLVLMDALAAVGLSLQDFKDFWNFIVPLSALLLTIAFVILPRPPSLAQQTNQNPPSP